MRIAPFAFFISPTENRTLIRDICWITHRNDEAYVGCLSVAYALRLAIDGSWQTTGNVFNAITEQIPDTLTRDNLLRLQGNVNISIEDAAALIGCSGHVVESVPFAIFAAQKIRDISFEDILRQVIMCGGDTDTNASIAGQVMGAYLGFSALPRVLVERFARLPESDYLLELADKLGQRLVKK